MRQRHCLNGTSKASPRRWGGWLSGLSSLLLWCIPATAAELQDWQFDTNRNQLQFTTDQAVRPRVQLISDPIRLVVDLPGIIHDQPTIKQRLDSQVRGIRVGQLDPQTTRIVVELAPGYVYDPQKVKVTGATPTQWSIQLPPPQRGDSTTLLAPSAAEPAAPPTPPITAAAPPAAKPTAAPSITAAPPAAKPTDPPAPRSTAVAPSAISTPPLRPKNDASFAESKPPSTQLAAAAAVTVEDIVATTSGFYIRTTGGEPSFRVDRDRKRRTSTLVIRKASLGPQINRTILSPRYHGVERIAIEQDQDTQTVRVTLTSTSKKQRWQVTGSKFGGIALVPKGKSLGSQPRSATSLLPRTTTAAPSVQNIATIKGVDLGGSQLLVRADRPLQFRQRWRGSTYEMTIPSAQLAPGVRKPRLGLGSALASIELKQQTPTTVVILARPARGVRVSKLERLSNGSLLLSLLRAGAPTTRPFPSQPPIATRPRLQPGSPLPRPSRRYTVVIDPGHGGRDPGAIGIGGLRETDVVLDISRQVSQLLQQQGVVVRMTRNRENFVSLKGRVAFAERVNASIFVSIHANAISLSRPDVNGLETFYAPGARQGARLARTIQNTILRSINMGSRGVRSARFYVIRKSTMPAALVETGFVTGQVDAPKLRNPAWRSRMAEAIARGILNYLTGRFN